MKVYAFNIEDVFAPAQSGPQSIAEVVNLLLPNIFLLAGIIMFFLIVGGGFMMIQGASSGEKGQMAGGKQAVTSALIGFIIIFVSYWIIKLISKLTGAPIL